jgi:two-component system, NarL family, response regulator DegU
MTLLIADDNREMRKMLKSICEEFFDETIECADGNEAVEVFRKFKPDWTIMDIKMNKMDGIEATEKIISEYPDAKVIIVSQYTDKAFIEAAFNSGAMEFVNKDNLTRIEEIIDIKNFE